MHNVGQLSAWDSEVYLDRAEQQLQISRDTRHQVAESEQLQVSVTATEPGHIPDQCRCLFFSVGG